MLSTDVWHKQKATILVPCEGLKSFVCGRINGIYFEIDKIYLSVYFCTIDIQVHNVLIGIIWSQQVIFIHYDSFKSVIIKHVDRAVRYS